MRADNRLGLVLLLLLASPVTYATTVDNTDFVIDFSGIGDTDPYTNGNLTDIDSEAIQIASGVLQADGGVTDGQGRWRIDGTATATVLQSSVEIYGSSYAQRGPGVFASNGEGYYAVISWHTYYYLYRVDSSGTTTDIGSGEGELGTAASDGDRFHLSYDTSDGSIEVWFESDSSIKSVTDTTYDSSALTPGFMLGGDGSQDLMQSFGGDYLSGGSGVTQINTLQNPSKTAGPHKSQTLGGLLDGTSP